MFRVEWLQSALDQFTDSWLKADSPVRQALTAASHQNDRELSHEPMNVGDSRDLNRRNQFVQPLTVTYEVDAGERMVTVLQICVYKPRR